MFEKSLPIKPTLLLINAPANDEVRPHVVLDLDHTLINSYEYGTTAAPETLLTPILCDTYKDDTGLPELYHAQITNVLLLIKLRPDARWLVRKLADSVSLVHIYTKGTRKYMEAVLKILDPEGNLVMGSLVSRDDEPPGTDEQRKDPKLVGAPEGCHVVVLDDSPFVWPTSSSQISVVAAQRYDFAERFVINLMSGVSSSLTSTPRRRRVYTPSPSAGPAKHHFPVDSDNYLRESGFEKIIDIVLSQKVGQRTHSSVSTAASFGNFDDDERASVQSPLATAASVTFPDIGTGECVDAGSTAQLEEGADEGMDAMGNEGYRRGGNGFVKITAMFLNILGF
jgi:hypothetical protein